MVARMDAILYWRSGDADSQLMKDYLRDIGIQPLMRQVDNGDSRAVQEWEDLDGQVTPVLVLDRRRIVRGFDRTRVDQLVGMIGC